jgi:hypothetical protein
MTPLRRKMIEEFQTRHYARFAQHLGQSVGTE